MPNAAGSPTDPNVRMLRHIFPLHVSSTTRNNSSRNSAPCLAMSQTEPETEKTAGASCVQGQQEHRKWSGYRVEEVPVITGRK